MLRSRRGQRGEPGPSPVGWIADEVFRAWNAAFPEAAHEKTPGKPISDAWLAPVTADDRRRAPVAPVPAGALVPPPGTLAEHAALLASTPGAGFIGSVHWPVCCERLTTLLACTGGGIDFTAIERHTGPLDDALTSAHTRAGDADLPRAFRETLAAMRAREHAGDGIAFFQCRACGRVYGATSEA